MDFLRFDDNGKLSSTGIQFSRSRMSRKMATRCIYPQRGSPHGFHRCRFMAMRKLHLSLMAIRC